MGWTHIGARVLGSTLLVACTAGSAAAQSQPGSAAAEPGVRFITTSDGVRLAVKVAGSGPPVLFIHGRPGQGTLSFERMGGSALEPFATMIYLDQRGSGRSDSAADYHLDRVVRDIEEVRAALGYDRVHLLAHSFGGLLAVNYAARHPERVAGIIMAAATVHFLSDELLAEQIAFTDSMLARPRKLDPSVGRDSLLALWAEARTALNQAGLGYKRLTETPETIGTMMAIDRSYARQQQFGAEVIGHAEAYPEYYRDYAPLTASVTAPTLVLAATRDWAIGPRHFETFRFPRQRVVTVNGGHLLYYENTAEFAAAVRRFLEDPPR